MRGLKELGIQLAIDDFGTGFSSLAYLKQFPVDILKIDRSFVDGLGRDPQDAAIVRSVVALAKSLDLSVTAEGIETPAQQTHLIGLGCEQGQGYLFSKPVPNTECDELLLLDTARQQRPRAADASQQEHLRALGCDAGQGYLFARPAPAREIEALLDGSAKLARSA